MTSTPVIRHCNNGLYTVNGCICDQRQAWIDAGVATRIHLSHISPAGIAVAAALIGGKRTLPWIFLGSLLLNIWIGYSANHKISTLGLSVAAIIAIASLLQAAAGGWGLRRLIGYPASLDKGGEIFRFLLSAPLICLISASISVSSLLVLGVIEPAGFATNWAAWWIGDTFGVVVMFPITMIVAGEPRSIWKGRKITVAVPMLVSFSLLVAIFLKTNQWEYNDSLSDFRQISQRTVNHVQTKFEEQESLLELMASLFIHDVNGRISRDEYHRFVQKSLIRFPMIQAVEWAEKVDKVNLSKFEAAHQRDLPGYEIRERNAAGQLQRAGERNTYYPVTYAEPLEGNQPAIGFDLGSNPQRLEAINKAKLSGTTAITAPLKLVQERQQQIGVLLLLVVDQHHNKSGVALTVLRMGDFMDKLVLDTRPMLYTRLVDLDDQKTLYNNFVQDSPHALYEQTFDFGTRHYRLETAPTPLYTSQHKGWQSWGVLAAGSLGTGLLGALLLYGTGYTARVESQVEDRTRKLTESESRFRLMADAAPVLIWTTDKDKVITWLNQTALAFNGLRPEQVIGNVWLNGIHPDDLQRCTDKFVRHFDRRETFQSDFRIKCHDGKYRWILDTCSPRFDEQGYFAGYIGSAIDINDRIEAEAKLQILSTAIEQSPISIIITDVNANIEYVNPRFSEITGYSSEEVIGRNPRIFKSGLTLVETYQDLWGRLSKGQVWQGELLNKRKDGKLYWEETHIAPVHNSAGVVTHYVAAKIDMSERKQLYDLLVQARIVAESANKSKSDFLANMSHEIRTPISAIIGFSFLAQRLELPQRALAYFNKINTAATSLLGIVNDILDFSKIEAGKMDMEVITFSLDDVIDNVANLFGNKVREKGIELTIGANSGVPTWLSGDPLRLTQVLTNLVNNAIKFTNHGEVSLLVEMIENEGDQVILQFVVKDTGIGMTPEQRMALFKPFVQADASTTRQYGGTGLGLVICQQLVSLMGGAISVESNVGQGSSFSFTAKFGIVNNLALASSFLAGKQVMVVDDSAVMRRLMIGLLRNLGCESIEADSGLTLINNLQAGITVDCIMMDWHMPGMDGVVASRHLREQAITVPIVIITGDEPELVRAEAGNLVQQIITKPVTPAKLFNSLVTLFGEKTTIQDKQSEQASIPDLSGRRILLVDDNEFNRQVGSELVELTKAAVDTVNDGQQAVNAVVHGDGNGNYDLILMDIQMPVMDGYAAAEVIRAKFPTLPIVALTADVVTGLPDRMIKAGMNDVLTKPIQVNKLYRTLARLLEIQTTTQIEVTPALQAQLPEPDSLQLEDGLPDLPGFDTQSALERVDGEISFYRRFLCMFRDSNASTLNSFRLSLEQGDMTAARRIIHTLKGTTATIGAVDLHDAVEHMESVLKSATLTNDVPGSESMKRLEKEWKITMAVLANLTA